MRIAIIADVHGNSIALKAVLADIKAASPDVIVNLGDLVSGPFDPVEAANMQMSLRCQTLRGNHDRWLVEDPSRRTDASVLPLLSRQHIDWLDSLPHELWLAHGEVIACHGSPAGGDTDYLLEDVSTGRATLAAEARISKGLTNIGSARVVLCGHTHVARAVWVRGVLVVNPGSVGWQAYSDDQPVPHAIETGSPHARYALITGLSYRWKVELRVVMYDWEAAAKQAERFGRPDVAYAARTGRIQPGAVSGAS